MHINLASSAHRAFALMTFAGCALHIYGQYPGPPENGNWDHLSASATTAPQHESLDGLTPFESSTRQQRDSELALPTESDSSASGVVSVAELAHPLSRKGRALLNKAENDLRAGKTTEAFAQIDKALKEPSAIPYAHSILGAAYLHFGRIPEAVAELEQAVQLLPIAVNYSNLGYAHCIAGDAAQGEQELRHALELDPSSPQAHFLIGLILLDRKSQNHEACEQFQRAQHTLKDAHIALAVCYVRGGQDDAADRQVKEFIGAADDGRFAFWKRWVTSVASQARPQWPLVYARNSGHGQKNARGTGRGVTQ